MLVRLISNVKDFFIRIKLKLGYEKIFYINSPKTLPPPLKKSEELELTERIAAGDEKAREPLIVHNLRLVVYIAKKFESSGVNIEDLVSIGTIGLIKSVNTFCPDKNIKLATYASRCIENEILMHLRKVNQQKGDVSLDEPLNTDWEGNELLLSDVLGSDGYEINNDMEDEDEKRILHLCMETLGERERLIMNMRFGLCGYKEHTQKEVADLLGISQSYISRLEKRIITQLKKDIEKITAD
ncbi:MAG: RNA polymerase sporulation sigma factor SigE [Ruminococcaceae bacterium]|nr:RNA polymerase sporulation sigma factor SigE [Oscillospiraceae bacterium]